ncbi:ATP synthase F0 subunit B [Desulfovibrio sp. OttesenSCG-928-C06]|nr:ATP synthase F0 subunit B [Desulfovibrio sp. OttesenSCG-928-C06]
MSSRAKIVILLIGAICVLAFVAGHGSHSPYVDFAFRTGNIALFIALVVFMWGGKIKAFFKGRTEGIATELASLEEAKAQAMKDLKKVEERIANLDKERQNILAEYKAQGEALKSEIIVKAEKTAKQVVAQAKLTAQSEVDKAIEQIRVQISEEVVTAAEKLLAQRLTPEEHEKLINKSLTKVVLH